MLLAIEETVKKCGLKSRTKLEYAGTDGKVNGNFVDEEDNPDFMDRSTPTKSLKKDEPFPETKK